MSGNNSSFVLRDSSSDETDRFSDNHSIIKEEMETYQKNNDNNQLYFKNVINKSNNITPELSNKDAAINVLEIKKENDDKNSILIIENNLVKDEIDIKEEKLTFLNDDNNETYTEKNVINKSNNITPELSNKDAINVHEIKTEKDDENSIFNIEDNLIKAEIDKNEILTYLNDDDNNEKYTENVAEKIEDNTTLQYNYNNNPSYHNENVFTKTEQMSPEYSDILTENILEIKTEIYYNTNNFETSMNALKNDHNDVNKHHDNNQLKPITNSYKKTYQCDVCQKIFTQQTNLKKHIFIHAVKKPNKCDICPKSFAQKIQLKTHMFTHTGKKPYNCNICHKSFTLKSGLKRHAIIHTGKKPYKCDICQKSYMQQVQLKSHMFTHTGKNPNKCDICQKSFSFKQSLKYHMSTHTGEKPYKCHICQKAFTLQKYLKSHIFTHTGEKTYKCDICHKPFSFKQSLKYHMFIHTGEKRYKCYICQKPYALKSYLKKHMFTHADEKPYKCDICQNTFTQKVQLKNHIFNHTGKKPYKCDNCKKSFTVKQSLKNHMFTHVDEKPYKCDICQNSFTQKVQLKNHIFTHIGKKTI